MPQIAPLDEWVQVVCRHEHTEAAGSVALREEGCCSGGCRGIPFAGRGVRVRLRANRQSSARTSSRVLPFIRASAWAKALATVKRCWRVDAVGGGHGDDKVAGDEPCALVEELEIGVLAVDTFFAEDDAAGGVGTGRPSAVRFCRGFPCRAG